MSRPARPALAFAFLACASGPAMAQTAPATTAKRCDIVVQSQAGGVIEMISGLTTKAGLPAPPPVTWRPAASSGAAELVVAYQNAAPAGLGEPSGLYIRFPIEPHTPPDSTVLDIRSANGRNWRFPGQAVEQGPGDTAFVEFNEDLAYGRALLGAIADGQTVSISVQHYDRAVGSVTFGTASQRPRDLLVAQARRKFETGDPASCQGG